MTRYRLVKDAAGGVVTRRLEDGTQLVQAMDRSGNLVWREASEASEGTSSLLDYAEHLTGVVNDLVERRRGLAIAALALTWWPIALIWLLGQKRRETGAAVSHSPKPEAPGA